MHLTVPKAAKWEHLWLECNGFLDLRFEDVTTFGKGMVELRMIYTGLCARGFGSDVLLSFALHKQGLTRITDAIDVGSKQKTLCAWRNDARSIARRVHDTCICGACGPCLMRAGVMHNHFPGDDAANANPSPFLFPSKRAPAVYYDPPQCEYAVSHGLNGKCGCDECVQRMLEMAKDGIDDDEDKEDEDEDSSGEGDDDDEDTSDTHDTS